MNAASIRVRNVYLVLNLFIWLPTALIVGINTLFLLDGGLNNVEAFAANAFYTVGLAVFELPTGMVADTWGRRTSFLLGAATQLVGNLLYVGCWYVEAPFWAWAVASVLLGLGFTFFPERSRRGWSTASNATSTRVTSTRSLRRVRSSTVPRCSSARSPAASSLSSRTSVCPISSEPGSSC